MAALAYGTESIPRVDKIVGPGNRYVAEAKRQLYGRVGIDMIAGPSEILVVADNRNDPTWIAADLLSQAEHDASSQSVLVTDDRDFADAVEQAVEAELETLPRAAIAGASWRDNGAVILVPSLADCAPIVDRIAAELHAGAIPLVGRTEAEVSAHLSARIVEEGHQHVNFAIVAAGENAASPHHHPGSRVIREGEVVLCDFGGTMNGYCSDITRCVHLGTPPAEVADAYAVLHEAQAAGVAAGVVGAECHDVDRAARRIIDAAGYGQYFIHRTGHGIGMEAHEDPYMVEGNTLPIAPGHAFSVEPGIYMSGKWGMRLEDIVVATDEGPLSMNSADHQLVVLG